MSQLATHVQMLQAAGKVEEAQAAYGRLVPLARAADPELPLMRRVAGIVAEWESQGGWSAPVEEPSVEEAEFEARRIDLTTLGPLTSASFPAEAFARKDSDGGRWSLEEHRGKNVVLIFYLGNQCTIACSNFRFLARRWRL